MIIVRLYQVLGEMVIESSALVTHDGHGNPQPPQAFFVGREYKQCQGAIYGQWVGDAVGWHLDQVQAEVAATFGGLHQLL